ncbi:hypothetical protein [Photobacterium sp. GSS17]|uniref:hypothetical protein n=1 Tax=Photobacterium sp. GSS17 TaxID=3020715 RepID=UPI00235DF645|nr:hypothetical protein [Photobacterium sp. GSS17]
METENTPVNDTELETVQGHTEQEEKAFINSLDDDFDPTMATTDTKQADIELEAAAGMIFVGLMTIEQMMKGMVHTRFNFDPEQSEKVAYKVAPLIVKYGGNPPPWMAKYMDEIMAVAAIGMLSLSSYMQVRQLKAEDLAAARREQAKRAAEAANDDYSQEVA